MWTFFRAFILAEWMSLLMEHGRPATFRNECEAVGQCFGTVNNSLSNESFVSISDGSVVLLQALFLTLTLTLTPRDRKG